MAKIAVINSIYQYGSTGRICKEMVAAFNESGYISECFYGEGPKKKGHSFLSPLSKMINVLLSRIDDRAGFHSFIATKRIIKRIKVFSPDVLIVHNMHAYYLNIKSFLNFVSANNLPVIFVLHDCWNFTGHCAYFSYIKCEKWLKCCQHCLNKNSYPTSWLIDNSQKNFEEKKKLFKSIQNKIFVTPSKWLSSLVSRSFLNDSKIVTVNNGIDLDVFKKGDIPKINGKVRILCVANIWDERKGLRDIISLSKMLNDTYEIVLVGKLKNKLDLPRNIRHINRTNNIEELVILYSSSNVFFNPTYEDNYPTVNMEALACGCPVICYKTGGAVETIKAEYIVEQGDLNRVIFLIKKIAIRKEPYNYPNVSQFDKKIQYKKYIDLVESLLKK